MKRFLLLFSILITVCISAYSQAPPVRTHFKTNAEMNVAATGSAYAFIYQGNSSDYGTVQGINAGDYWKCENCSGSNIYGRVASVVDNGNGYFYVYLTDMNGNSILPESGKSYSYSDTTLVPVLCCGGSSAPFNINPVNNSKVMNFVTRPTSDSQVYIQQVGNANGITVEQTGTKNNYVDYHGQGTNNNILINQQGNPTTAVNFVELSVVGNSNTVSLQQSSTGGAKGAFVTIQDSNNSLTLLQTGSGNHLAEVTLTGGNKTVDITQDGSAGHQASIALCGQPSSLSLQQAGSTQQSYSIQFNCATAGGCAPIVVKQGK